MRCCCYCLSVKQGSYLAAGWSLVYSGLQLGDIYHEETQQSILIPTQVKQNYSYRESVINPEGWKPKELSVMYSFLLSTYILVMLSLPFLLVGLRKGVANLLVPWLVTTFMATLADTSINLYILIDKRKIRFEPLTAFVFTSAFFIFVIQVYSLLCVVSQYKYSKEGLELLVAEGNEVEPSVDFVTGIYREQREQREQLKERNQLSRISEEDEKSGLCEGKTSDGAQSGDSPLTISANIEHFNSCDNTDSEAREDSEECKDDSTKKEKEEVETKGKPAIAKNVTVVADHTVRNEGCEIRKEARKELREDRKELREDRKVPREERKDLREDRKELRENRKKALEARRTFLNPTQTYNEQRKKRNAEKRMHLSFIEPQDTGLGTGTIV